MAVQDNNNSNSNHDAMVSMEDGSTQSPSSRSDILQQNQEAVGVLESVELGSAALPKNTNTTSLSSSKKPQSSSTRRNLRESFFEEGARENTRDLAWRNVNMYLKSSKKPDNNPDATAKGATPAVDVDDDGCMIEKRILNNVWGQARAGELSALMGASGAGKTSLFNVLAGRIRSSGRLAIQANDIYLGDRHIDPAGQRSRGSNRLFAFVAQQNALHPAMSPRQSLTFSARLRLPRDTTDEDIANLVDRYISELGLEKCGDTMTKKISGGEQRRTYIGVELISQPELILLDEPTSGLDSFAARQVMKLLQKVARAGNVVLFTIHQPSSDVFGNFDHLMLLNQGRLMYQGPAKHVTESFDLLGYPVPPNYNPADWILDVAQTNDPEHLKDSGFYPDDTSKSNESSHGDTSPSDKGEEEDTLCGAETPPSSQWTQLKMLMEREKIGLYRNPITMIISIGITAFLSIVFGVIFYQIGSEGRESSTVVNSQFGAVVNILISTMMSQVAPTLAIFAVDRPLFLREYATRHYLVLPYFISKLIFEALQTIVLMMVQALIVFFMIDFQQTFLQFMGVTFTLAMTSQAVALLIGAIFMDHPETVSSVFTLAVVPQFYFSGVFIAISLIPKWVRWAQYLCSLTYASRLMTAYEFASCAAGEAAQNCQDIMDQNYVKESKTGFYWLGLVGLFVWFRLTALYIIRRRASDSG